MNLSRTRLLCTLAVAALAAGAVLAAQDAQAHFAASAGFSGRSGPTCLACHTLAPAPLTPPPATAVLAGLPATWLPGATYDLTVRVEGGPTALPAPQPQGGFDLAVSRGTLLLPAGSADLLRLVGTTEATYRPAGTLQREWHVTWQAPGLDDHPADATVWLAVLAANGNHAIATNASDGGERFDSAASLVRTVPPSAQALQAWRALPLAVPDARVAPRLAGVDVAGEHRDANATHLAWSLDGGPWQSRPTGPSWRIVLDQVPAGDHRVDLRSEGLDRASPLVHLAFHVDAAGSVTTGSRDSPGTPALLGLAAISVALTLSHAQSRRPR